MPTSYMERSMSQFGDIAAQIARGVRTSQEKKKRDRIAQELAAQYGLQGVDDMDELKLALEMERANADKRHKEALIQRALREPQGRNGTSALNADGTPPDPIFKDGMVWNGRHWVKAPNTTTNSRETFNALDREVKAVTGAPLSKWTTATNKRVEDGMFKAKSGSDELAISEDLYNKFLGRYNKIQNGVDPNASALATPVKPQVTPIPGAPIKVTTKAERDALPPGTRYIAPDGTVKIKQ